MIFIMVPILAPFFSFKNFLKKLDSVAEERTLLAKWTRCQHKDLHSDPRDTCKSGVQQQALSPQCWMGDKDKPPLALRWVAGLAELCELQVQREPLSQKARRRLTGEAPVVKLYPPYHTHPYVKQFTSLCHTCWSPIATLRKAKYVDSRLYS